MLNFGLKIVKAILSIMSASWSESKKKVTRALVRAGLLDDPRERVLTNAEVQFPPDLVTEKYLETRGKWMGATGEKWKYTKEDRDRDGAVAIHLEGWLVSRTCHQLLENYGMLHQTRVEWGGFVITLNIIAINDKMDINDLPALLETGSGNAYTVAMATWNTYRDYAKDQREEDDEWIPVGKRLIYHALIDKTTYPFLSLEDFRQWPAAMVWDWMDIQRAGMYYIKNSPDSVGLTTEKIENPIQGEELLAEISIEDDDNAILACGQVTPEKSEEKGEKEKEKEKVERIDEERGIELSRKSKAGRGKERALEKDASPHLGPVGPRRHDIDEDEERKASRKQKKRKDRRKRGRKGKRGGKGGRSRSQWSPLGEKNEWSPLVLTLEQEANLARMLILSFHPQMSEEEVEKNIREQRENRRRAQVERGFGENFGEWRVVEDYQGASRFPFPPPPVHKVEKEMKGYLDDVNINEVESVSSGPVSPRAELSQMMVTPESGNWRSDVSGASMMSEARRTLESEESSDLVISPILVRKRTASQILTLSTSSSTGSLGSASAGKKPSKRSRMSLGSLLGSGRISFPEDGIMADILVDVVEEETDSGEVFEEEAGDSNQSNDRGKI